MSKSALISAFWVVIATVLTYPLLCWYRSRTEEQGGGFFFPSSGNTTSQAGARIYVKFS